MGSIEHIGAFCAAALRMLFSPFHYLFHVALSVGFAYGVWDRVAAWRSLRLSIRSILGAAPREKTPLWYAARQVAVDVDRIVVVDGLPNPAFTAGLFRPRIYVSSDLEGRLRQIELDCVIAHEAAHVRRRDPLRLSIFRFLSCLLFWMPGLRGLAADISDEAEIEADNAAGRRDPLALASAILQLASAPTLTPSAVGIAGFNHPDLLDRRIRRLAGQDTPLPSRVGRRAIVFASLALVLVVFSGVAAAEPSAHPASAAGENHCSHHHGSLWSHLRCSSRDCHEGATHCHHADMSAQQGLTYPLA
ncbi:MAG TPA: M56 family metallopeptidase [Gemmatimonadaceae bacterium]|nr:M56 family metallopeptidase [Gemmatimonadaceae bacterium]